MTDQTRPDQPATPGSPDKSKLQPSKKLPTNRITFPKQLDVLRAYGIESQGGTRTANMESVAKLVAMASTTVALMNTFLVENGFIERNGNEVTPARGVVEFAAAHQWAPDTAPRKLAPIIKRSWFGTRLASLLAFRSIPIEQAVQELAQEAQAGPEYKAQVEFMIDYAVAAGVVRREGNQLFSGESQDAEPAPQPGPALPQAAESRERDDPPSRAPQPAVATGFMTTEGGVQFHVGIRVTMQEMGGWAPDRIAAFFAGLAQVLAAKKGTEEI